MTSANSLFKSALLMGLICLAGLLIVVGLYVCYTVKGDQLFIIGVLVIAVGFVLFASIKDFVKGVFA